MRKTLGVALLTITVMGAAASSALAQGYGLTQQTGAQETWDDQGWHYVARGGQWVRTGLARAFPNPADRNLFDLYENGRFIKRVDLSHRGRYMERPAAHNAATSQITWVAYPAWGPANAQTLQFFIPAWGRWTTLHELQSLATQRVGWNPNNPTTAAGTVGGTRAPGGGTPISGPDATALAAQATGLHARIVGGRY